MSKVSKASIRDNIVLAIKTAAKEYYEMSGQPYRRAPEYLTNVKIANALAHKHPALGYQLETRAKELLEKLNIVSPKHPDKLRKKGNIDIVLLSRKSSNPRHIIEVKRSIRAEKLKKDAERLAAFASEKHDNQRLKTNFIVAVNTSTNSKNSTSQNDRLVETEEKLSELLGEEFTVNSYYSVLKPGTYGYKENHSLAISIIEISKKLV